jgi:hypothetical protein
LSALPRLKILGLARTHVTPAAIARLKAASRLELVILGGTRFRDDQLVQLSGMSTLRVLGLGGSQVSDDDVNKLQLALPRLKMRRGIPVSRNATPTAGRQTALGTDLQ